MIGSLIICSFIHIPYVSDYTPTEYDGQVNI